MHMENFPKQPQFDAEEDDAELPWFAEHKKLQLAGQLHAPAVGAEEPSDEKLDITLDEETPLDQAAAQDKDKVTPEAQAAQSPVKQEKREVAPKGPSWKLVNEKQPVNTEEESTMATRQRWLQEAFDDKAGGFKENLLAFAERSLDLPKGEDSFVGKRFGSFSDDASAREMLADFAARDVSVGELIGSAKTFKQLQAMKILSLSLLDRHMENGKQKLWDELSESDKREIRLAELIDLQIGQRQMEMMMRVKKMDPELAQRRYEVYKQRYETYKLYCQNPDIPNSMKEKFEQFATRFETEYAVEKIAPKPKAETHPQSAVTTEPQGVQPASAGQEGSAMAINAILGQVDIDKMKKMKRQDVLQLKYTFERVGQMLRDADPEGVGAEFREIAESGPGDMLEYNEGVLDRLKNEYHCEGDEQAEGDRRRFIDSMSLQMSHAMYLNSNPSVWNRLFRGTVDGIRTRWQVLGAGMFWPFGATSGAERMARARQEAAKSWGALAQAENYTARGSAMAHAVELSLVNANELLDSGHEAQPEEDVYGSKLNAAYQAQLRENEPSSPAPDDVWPDANAWGKQYEDAQFNKTNEAVAAVFKKDLEKEKVDEAAPVLPTPPSSSEAAPVPEVKLFDKLKQWQEIHPNLNYADWRAREPNMHRDIAGEIKNTGGASRVFNPERYFQAVRDAIEAEKKAASGNL